MAFYMCMRRDFLLAIQSLVLIVVTCTASAEKLDWPPATLSGVWIVDSGLYEYADGSKTPKDLSMFLLVLPDRIVTAAFSGGGLKKIKPTEFTIIGQQATDTQGHLLLCRDFLDRNTRAKLRSIDGKSIKFTILLRAPAVHFRWIMGRKVPIDLTKYPASLTYRATRAKVKDWGGVIRSQLETNGDIDGDRELTAFLNEWSKPEPNTKVKNRSKRSDEREASEPM